MLQRVTRLHLLQSASFAQTFARHGLTFGEFEMLAALRRAARPWRMKPTELFAAVEDHLAHDERLLAGLSTRERDELAALLRKLLLSEPLIELGARRARKARSPDGVTVQSRGRARRPAVGQR